MADVREKALTYLREENVRIVHADTPPGGTRPDEVRALVRGYRDTYRVTLSGGVWSCVCGAEDCAHVAAAQMVTGYRSAASKQEKAKGGKGGLMPGYSARFSGQIRIDDHRGAP